MKILMVVEITYKDNILTHISGELKAFPKTGPLPTFAQIDEVERAALTTIKKAKEILSNGTKPIPDVSLN